MAGPEHQWDTSMVKKMEIEDISGAMYQDMPTVIDPMEAERFVESIRKFTVEEVGDSSFMEQHRRMEKLNIQAHQNAMTNSDEFVLESILLYEKLGTLIDNLITIEAWKEFVYPKLLDRVAGRNNIRIYFVLYHEATLVNLLEVLLYHKHVITTGGEKLIELVDYIARKMTRLNSGYDFRQHTPTSSQLAKTDDLGEISKAAKDMESNLAAKTPAQELTQHLTEIEFRVCIGACSLVRFFCEHADAVPLSVVSRVADVHDMLMLITPLIENPPWTRRTDKGKWQKLIDHKWSDIQPIDLMKVTKLEGQQWIALYYFLARKEFRERYSLNSFRKGQVLRVRKFINDVLLDQLPFLADIMRYMDELAIMEVPSMSSDNAFNMFQQVAVTRDAVVKGKDWDSIANEQMLTVFTMTDRDDQDVRRLAEVYSDDLAENVLEPQALDIDLEDLE
jgi:hypothetical protein